MDGESPSRSGGQLGGNRLAKLTRHVRANGGDKMVIDDDRIATGANAGLLIFEERFAGHVDRGPAPGEETGTGEGDAGEADRAEDLARGRSLPEQGL